MTKDTWNKQLLSRHKSRWYFIISIRRKEYVTYKLVRVSVTVRRRLSRIDLNKLTYIAAALGYILTFFLSDGAVCVYEKNT